MDELDVMHTRGLALDNASLGELVAELRRMNRNQRALEGTCEKHRQQLERAIETIGTMRNVAPSVVRAELEAAWSHR